MQTTFPCTNPARRCESTSALVLGRGEGALAASKRSERASVLVIVLWVCIGLVTIALYFANSMSFELRAADNRVNGVVSDQAIEGAARYFAVVLLNYATNGALPDTSQFKAEAVTIGDAKFWMIGRDPSGQNSTDPYFGIIDEASKINVNNANTNTLSYLPNMTMDFSDAIQDWRSTNGMVPHDYSSSGYQTKYAPFETVDELRLVYGATPDLLVGEDINRNGVLDKDEKDFNANGELDPGLFEYVTVYTREPNFHSDGTTLTNVNTANTTGLTTLFRDNGVSNPDQRATQIYSYLHPAATGIPARGGGGGGGGTTRTVNGLFDFAVLCRTYGMTAQEFSQILPQVATSTNLYMRGRINVNTASEDVMTALFMGLNVDQSTAESAAQTLVSYRTQNAGNLGSVAWVYDALGANNQVVTALRTGDFITTHSFQFTADIAAVGAYGRGYRRVKFIFDVSDGVPKILYRQDLSRLGWALGDKARQNLLANNTQ
jgi:type II secretory pathway component PulK